MRDSPRIIRLIAVAAIAGVGCFTGIARAADEVTPGVGGAANVDGLTQAAGRGDVSAQSRLALMYATGEGVERDDRAAIAWWTQAANSGDSKAQWELGVEYVAGTRVKRDYIAAFDWFQRAADQGQVLAEDWLAKMLGGEYPGIARDDAKALYWYRKAADQGDITAAASLGDAYSAGKAVQQDTQQAIFWWHRAAEKGQSESQLRLAATYLTGRGVPVDFPLAAHWYEAAAVGGRADAALTIADMYRTGLGVQVDYPKATKFYQQSARTGSENAQVRLGEMYETGRGVPKDLVIAYAWNDLAIERKMTSLDRQLELEIRQSLPPEVLKQAEDRVKADRLQAADNIERISKSLSSRDIERAHQLAMSWQPGAVLSPPLESPTQ